MVAFKKLLVVKILAIFLSFLIWQGDFTVFAQQGQVTETKKNYTLSKQFIEKAQIEGIDFTSLIEYQRNMLGKKTGDHQPANKDKIIEKPGKKKKKKKSVLLIVLGVVVVGAVVAVLLKGKKKSDLPSSQNPQQNYAQEVYNSIEWIDIPAGEFQMGDNFGDGHSDERPVHTVYLDPFKISKYEVTFDQYDAFCDDTSRSKPPDEGWGRADRPVIFVTWDDAKAFCDWLGQKVGQTIHLPTEAQWEKAARGTDQRKYPWGNGTPSCSLANYNYCQGQTMPVGSYSSDLSPYGAFDMAGNVYEWCSDWYSSSYYSESPRDNPTGPLDGIYRVARGNSWNSVTFVLRSANRLRYLPSSSLNSIGFRIVQD